MKYEFHISLIQNKMYLFNYFERKVENYSFKNNYLVIILKGGFR